MCTTCHICSQYSGTANTHCQYCRPMQAINNPYITTPNVTPQPISVSDDSASHMNIVSPQLEDIQDRLFLIEFRLGIHSEAEVCEYLLNKGKDNFEVTKIINKWRKKTEDDYKYGPKTKDEI